MNRQLEDKLFKEFPLLYSKEQDHVCDNFTFECLDGWYDLLHAFSAEISPLIEKARETDKDPYEFVARIVRIREKYGALRIHLSTGTDAMYEIIEEYELKSESTCEVCGAPGTINYAMTWKSCACEDHQEL